MHDCCHCIYFALPPSYHPSEVGLNLPCEDTLWQARNSTDWFMALQAASPYGDLHIRLTGASIPHTLSTLAATQTLDDTHVAPNPFAHFVLIHAILRHLFVVCVNDCMVKPAAGGPSDVSASHEIYGLQYALHNWLRSWHSSPELPRVEDGIDEPPFVHNGKFLL